MHHDNGAPSKVYQLSEFLMESELEFRAPNVPLAPAGAARARRADIRLMLGATPAALDRPSFATPRYQLDADQRFLLTVPDVARFVLTRDGDLTIEPFANPDRPDLRLFVLGTIFAVWLAMQGFLPIHAGAVRTKGGAALVCGRSGAGKSTTMAMLARDGWPILADDLSIVSFGDQAELLAFSGQVKLRPDVLAAFGEDPDSYASIVTDRTKHAFPVGRSTGRRPVAKILVLHAPDRPSHEAGPQRGAAAVRTLMRQVYRPRLIGRVLGRAVLFEQIARLTRQVELVHVRRTRDYTLASDILAQLEAEGSPYAPS